CGIPTASALWAIIPGLKPCTVTHAFLCSPQKRHFSARIAPPADRLHAGLVDAPGRTLLARISRDTRKGGLVHGAGPESRTGDGSHSAAARTLPAGRGDFVLRYPDRA